MPVYTHREPAVLGAGADNSNVYVELICDVICVHPSVVRNTLCIFGDGRVMLISDSMRQQECMMGAILWEVRMWL